MIYSPKRLILFMEEILQTVEVGSLSHYLQGFDTSQVVFSPDLFHQKYLYPENSEEEPFQKVPFQ